MVRAGMTPMEVILASTRDAARVLELEDAGTVEVGKTADLVIVQSDSIDDMSSLEDVRHVIKQGQVVTR
jgi:imidazolonepropionase-like amidohydrolase